MNLSNKKTAPAAIGLKAFQLLPAEILLINSYDDRGSLQEVAEVLQWLIDECIFNNRQEIEQQVVDKCHVLKNLKEDFERIDKERQQMFGDVVLRRLGTA